jgi:hypothetical protein
VDRFGEWVVTGGMEDWWGSPDTKGVVVERPDADGDLDLPVYNQSRLLTLSGSLHTDSHEQMHEAQAFFASPMFGRFTVAGHGPTQWADGKRNSGAKFLPVTDKFAQWQIRLKFNDPRKYGETRTWAASVGADVGGIYHRGNYDATPRFVVAGSMPGGYTLTIKGLVFNVVEPLVAGHPHSIDYGDGRLRIDGAIVHGGRGYGFTPLVTPGVPTALSIVPGTTGTATATLTLVDTYI